MTYDTDQSKDAGSDASEHREALAESLRVLSEQLSSEHLSTTISDVLKSQSEQVSKSLVDGSRDNPLAVSLVGAGLAWLMLGPKLGGQAGEKTRGTPRHSSGSNPSYPGSEFLDPVAAGSAANRDEEISEHGQHEDVQRKTQPTAAQLRDTLYDGTAQLSDVARARVVDARKAALAAQERIELSAQLEHKNTGHLETDHTLLVVAGLALMGAAAATALPRSEQSDEDSIAQRDTLMADAERVFTEELSRAKALGLAALGESDDMTDDAPKRSTASGEQTVDFAEARLRQSGERGSTGRDPTDKEP